MKNLTLVTIILAILLMGCSKTALKNNIQGINKFNENYAISQVVKEHPEFMGVKESKEISLNDVGKYGHTLTGILEIKAEKNGQDEYIITLTKRWNIKVNGTDAVSYWKYKVTPGNTTLIDSQEKADIVNIIK